MLSSQPAPGSASASTAPCLSFSTYNVASTILARTVHAPEVNLCGATAGIAAHGTQPPTTLQQLPCNLPQTTWVYIIGTTAQRPVIDLTKRLSAQTKASTPPSPAPGFKLTSSTSGADFLSQTPSRFYRNRSSCWWCQRSFLTVLNVGLVPMAGHHGPQTEPPLAATEQETAAAEAS